MCRRAFERAICSIIEWVIYVVKEENISGEAIFKYLGFCQS
jgi:hypothetical protein